MRMNEEPPHLAKGARAEDPQHFKVTPADGALVLIKGAQRVCAVGALFIREGGAAARDVGVRGTKVSHVFRTESNTGEASEQIMEF